MDRTVQIAEEGMNRLQGGLKGFAAGDAMGATTEFMSPVEIKKFYGIHRDISGGGWLELEPGQVTDDTEMTLCITRSLVECRGYNLKDISDRFVDWYNSDPVDIGSTCRAGINRYIRTGCLEALYNECGAGNGGVMRALPLILLYSADPGFMLSAVVSQSRLTHNNKESDMGCRCYADLVVAALSGVSKDDLKKVADWYPLFAPGKFDGKSGGHIVETLRTVLHYFFNTGSLEECLVGVVNNGQDADTDGAIAGELAGAFYGIDAIPARWLDALDRGMHNELGQLADQLAALKETL